MCLPLLFENIISTTIDENMKKRLRVEEEEKSRGSVIDLTVDDEDEDDIITPITVARPVASSGASSTVVRDNQVQSRASIENDEDDEEEERSDVPSAFPSSVSLSPSTERIKFLLLDCCVKFHADRPAIIHLLGKTAAGKLVHIHVLGFRNYFYADPKYAKKEDLLMEKGVVSVTECKRAPLYFYRRAGEMRDMFQVHYSFHDKKDKPSNKEGRFETDIKLKRRFMTERKIGAGCTVTCRLSSKAESEKTLFGECSFDQVFRVENDTEEVSSSVLRVLAIDVQRSHNPKRSITARCIPEKRDPIVCVACYSSSASTLFILDTAEEAAWETQNLTAGWVVSKRIFPTEHALIQALQAYLSSEDPDVLVGWDIVTHLEALQDSLKLSRLDPSIPLKSKKVVNYSAAWVRRPNARMSSTSNQQTTKLTDGIEGRILLDLLRTTTTKHKLQRYTLAESIGHFLWQVKPQLRSSPVAFGFEELEQPTVSTLWRDGKTERVTRYCFGRAVACMELLRKQSLVEETLQAGSTALLTLSEVTYGAQMVRVHSLLARKMYDTDRIAAGSSDRSEGVLQDPINAPFLINPDEAGTQGLYLDEPVAVLDFASLYPSIIIAFNLCYSTYVHESDRHYFQDVPPPRKTGSATSQLSMAPAYPETAAVERHLFVSEAVAPGIVPQLLRDLLRQREEVKQRMSGLPESDYQRVILDQRQTQLKLSANATYGFIGASASPLSFVAVAETVLRWGQAICRRAVGTVAKQYPECKVIYGQTDSLFISLGSDCRDPEGKAKRIAEEITKSIGRDPVRIKFEKVYSSLLLSGVNRYAGRLLNSGELEIVGIESESRKECGLVRKALRDFLQCVLIDRADPFQSLLPRLMEYSVPRTLPSDLVLTHALWRNTVSSSNGTPPVKKSSSASSSPVKNGDGESDAQPHLQVARRVCQHDEDVSFVLGERVAFIFRMHPEFKRQADKARAPFEEQDILPDLTLYVKHKLIPPLGRLARLVDLKRWQELESAWLNRGVWTMTVCPRGARKCLGKAGCRFLVKEGAALCERCQEEGLLSYSRTHWERECNCD